MSKVTVTAVTSDLGFYAGPPSFRTAHSALSLRGGGGIHVVAIEVEAGDIESVFSELNADDSTWTELQAHDYSSVAALWTTERINEHTGLIIYKIGEDVTSWHGAELSGPAKMTRRDDLKPGDEFQSSHYGRTTVKSVSSRGLTTGITGTRANQSESYPRDGLVPVFVKAI